jgi:prepilin-type processing-associated H-X9-DG protein
VLNPVFRRLDPATGKYTAVTSPTLKSSVIKISNDFLSFHGNAQSAGSQNIVFLDCHVEAPSPTASQ